MPCEQQLYIYTRQRKVNRKVILTLTSPCHGDILGNGGMVPCILNHDTRGGWVVSFMPTFYAQVKQLLIPHYEDGVTSECFWMLQSKISLVSACNWSLIPLLSSLQPNHCTEWDILALCPRYRIEHLCCILSVQYKYFIKL